MMSREYRALPGILGLALLTLLVSAFATPARTQSANLVLCDRIAAEPSDPEKPKDIKGVTQIAAADIALAIKFCKIASSSSRRALYQLGRAYVANKQTAEAITVYRKATDKGSTSAMVDLGIMLAPKQPAQARALFERAAQAGNPRGITNLAALSGGVPSDPVKARALFEKAAAQFTPGRSSEWALLQPPAAADQRTPMPPKPITRRRPRSVTMTRRRRSSGPSVPT